MCHFCKLNSDLKISNNDVIRINKVFSKSEITYLKKLILCKKMQKFLKQE